MVMKVIIFVIIAEEKFRSQIFIIYNMDCVHVDDLLTSKFSVESDVIKCAIKILLYALNVRVL
jgi:hypothetical protein